MSKLGWLVVIGGGVLLIVTLILGLISPFLWSRGIGGYQYGWGMMGGFGFLMMGMMGLGMIVFWVFIIGGIISLGQLSARGTDSHSIAPHGESAFEILQRRYSRGEITKEQFETMKRDLGF